MQVFFILFSVHFAVYQYIKSKCLYRTHVKVGMFWYVSTYEFIGIFYTSFLPRGVCIRKIDNHIVFAFHVQAFGN